MHPMLNAIIWMTGFVVAVGFNSLVTAWLFEHTYPNSVTRVSKASGLPLTTVEFVMFYIAMLVGTLFLIVELAVMHRLGLI